MSITIASGDILQRKETFIVIPVNCVGAVGKGLALEWALKYPELVHPYKASCKEGGIKPGEFNILKAASGQSFLITATKGHFKDPSKIEWVSVALNRLGHFMEFNPYSTLALPPIGGGCGWLGKDKIIKLIHRRLDFLGKRVVLVDNET